MSSTLRIRSTSPVDDATQLGRRVRDLAVDGTAQIAKRADVPHLVVLGRDNAAAVVNDAMDRVSGRRKRRATRRRTLLLATALVTVGLAAWWSVRSGALAALRSMRDDDRDDDFGVAASQTTLDATALSRATDDGMGAAFPASDPMTAPDGDPADHRLEFAGGRS